MWKRLGTPTGAADSGTEEEFNLFIDPSELVTYPEAPSDPALDGRARAGGLMWAIQHGGIIGFVGGVKLDGSPTSSWQWELSFFNFGQGRRRFNPDLERRLEEWNDKADSIWDKFHECEKKALAERDKRYNERIGANARERLGRLFNGVLPDLNTLGAGGLGMVFNRLAGRAVMGGSCNGSSCRNRLEVFAQCCSA